MLNETETINKIVAGDSETLSQEFGLADTNEQVGTDDGDERKRRSLRLNLAEAQHAYDEEKQAREEKLAGIGKVLWLKKDKIPNNTEQSFAFQRFQLAQKALDDFEAGLREKEDGPSKEATEKNEMARIEKVVEIIGSSEIGELIIELKKTQGEEFVGLFAKIFSLLARSIFEAEGFSSLSDLKKEKFEIYREKLESNPKASKLTAILEGSIKIEGVEDMYDWTLEMARKLLMDCGVKLVS